MNKTRINFGHRPGGRISFSERMERGGLFFYAVAGIAAAAVFSVLWLLMAVGVIFNL